MSAREAPHEIARARVRAADARAAVSASVVVGAVYAVPLVSGDVMLGRDLTFLDLGTTCATVRHVDEGLSLSVSPFIGNGTPFAVAPESQSFSFVKWASLAFPVDVAVSVGAVLHFMIGAAAMALLARSFGARPRTAALIGASLGFVGPVVDLREHGFYIVAASALPLVWWGARMALSPRARPKGVVVAALALAHALLAGEPQTAGVGISLILVEVARHTRLSRARLAFAAPVLVACGAGVLVGLFPWWTTLVELTLTARGAALDDAQGLMWSLGPVDLWRSLLPGTTTSVLDDGALLAATAFGRVDTWIQEPYLGAPLLGLAVVGARVRRARVATVTAVVGFLAACGAHTPFLPMVHTLVPPLAAFRYPAKYLVVTTMALLVLAAVGSSRLERARRRARVPLVVVVVAHAVAVVCLGALFVRIEGTDEALGRFVQERALTLALTCGALIVCLVRAPRAVPFVVLFDLALATLHIVEVGPSVTDARSIIDVLDPHVARARPIVCATSAIGSTAYGGGYHPFEHALFARRWHSAELQACDGASSAVPYNVFENRTHRMLQSLVDDGRVVGARALGCDVLVTDAAVDEPESTRLVVHGALGASPVPRAQTVEENKTPGPRVLLVDDARPEVAVAVAPALFTGELAVAQALVDGRTAAELARVVDDPLARLAGPLLPDGRGVTHVELTEEGSTRATVHVEGVGGAVVVWNRVLAVGWRAQQEGRALPIVRASGVSLAVVVDDVTRGPISLAYVPPRRAIAWVSLLSGALALAGAVVLARRRRANPDQPASSPGV